jgi:hypothetical protein
MRRVNGQLPRAGRIACFSAALVMAGTTSCALAPSDFAKKTGDTASTFAAAETTIRLRHESRLTLAYARGSFVNYRDALEGVDEELAMLPGAPGPAEVQRLVALFRAAESALEDPCLENACDPEPQERVLREAAEAFAKAAEE